MNMRIAAALGAVLVASGAVATAVWASGLAVPPVRDAATAKECGACHMLYPAALLPARSWQALMAGLDKHFDENAELDDKVRESITAYLTANAADRAGRGGKVLRDLRADATPLRISETPWFVRKHGRKGRTAPETLARRGAKSAADCKACHRGAEQGIFDEH